MASEVTPDALTKLGYFRFLDFAQPGVAQFEKWLLAHEGAVICALDDGDKEVREHAALSLAYMGLLILNSSDGIRQGYLHLQDFQDRKSKPANGSTQAALLERLLRARHYMELAHRVLPNDARVQGWYTGTRVRTGEDDYSQLLHVAEQSQESQVFNTFSAMIVAREVEEVGPIDLERIKRLADAFTGKNSPCTSDEPQIKSKCVSGERTPFSQQAAFLILADVYLTAAVRKRPEPGQPLDPKVHGELIKVKVMLNMLKFAPGVGSRTDHWPLKSEIDRRIEWADRLLANQSETHPLTSATIKTEGHAVYNCSACHTPNERPARQDEFPHVLDLGL